MDRTTVVELIKHVAKEIVKLLRGPRCGYFGFRIFSIHDALIRKFELRNLVRSALAFQPNKLLKFVKEIFKAKQQA